MGVNVDSLLSENELLMRRLIEMESVKMEAQRVPSKFNLGDALTKLLGRKQGLSLMMVL